MFGFKKKDPGELLKDATSLKKSGDIDGAIECLRKAYKEIEKSSVVYDVKTFLRLPLYLQEAKKNDEAWSEFNKLISKGYPNQMKSKELIPMDASIIYDKMRLFLQREKQPEKAVKIGVFSHLQWAQGLYYQERKDELENMLSPESIEKLVLGLLKKAKLADMKDIIVNEVNESLENFPTISYSKLGNTIDSSVVKNNLTSA